MTVKCRLRAFDFRSSGTARAGDLRSGEIAEWNQLPELHRPADVRLLAQILPGCFHIFNSLSSSCIPSQLLYSLSNKWLIYWCWEPQVSVVHTPSTQIQFSIEYLLMSKLFDLIHNLKGFTGRLITQYLYSHPDRSSFSLALGARSQSKLAQLKQELGLDDSVKTFQVDVLDEHQVEEVVKQVQVVINTVGPFYKWGTYVVQYVACLAWPSKDCALTIGL